MAAPSSDLKISVDEPRAWARRLHITVPADRLERERRDVARRIAQRVNLPGFRQGKVPSKIIEQRYGPAIDQETVERVVGNAYREAVQQKGFEPITQAEVENVDYAPGAELTFDVEFEVRPEIELERLGGFKLKLEPPEVDDEDVERVLGRLREDHAVWRPLEETSPAPKDLAVVEMLSLDEQDEPTEAEPRRYDIVLGEGQALPDVEEAVQTLRPGEEGDFTVAITAGEGEDAGAEEHRVRLRLVEAKRPELPELDDELARTVGDFEDLDALRARVREDLDRQAEREAERDLRRELIDRIIEANPFEVPDAMVDNYLDQALRPREEVDPERLDQMRQAARPSAERAIKRILIIERVAERNGLRATQDDVDARVEQLAERHEREPGEIWAQLQRSGQLQALEDEITEEKVFELLKEQSTIK